MLNYFLEISKVIPLRFLSFLTLKQAKLNLDAHFFDADVP